MNRTFNLSKRTKRKTANIDTDSQLLCNFIPIFVLASEAARRSKEERKSHYRFISSFIAYFATKRRNNCINCHIWFIVSFFELFLRCSVRLQNYLSANFIAIPILDTFLFSFDILCSFPFHFISIDFSWINLLVFVLMSTTAAAAAMAVVASAFFSILYIWLPSSFFSSLLFNFCYTHILFPCLLFSVCACVYACVCLVFNTVFVFTNRHSAFRALQLLFPALWKTLCVFFTLAPFGVRVCVWVFTLQRDINKCVAHIRDGTHEHIVFCTRHQIDGASKWRPIQTRKLKFSTEFKCHSFFGIVYIFIGICMHVWVCDSVSAYIHHHTFGCGVWVRFVRFPSLSVASFSEPFDLFLQFVCFYVY